MVDGNSLSNNIGLHGGAIHIDNYLLPMIESEGDESPLILLRNNIFNKNIAYFEGNAIFIQGDSYKDDLEFN